MKKIGIIGSGISGLASAAILAKEGYQVTVFEKHNQPGGRARIMKENGFTFDMGPSWYWMPEVFEDFFKVFGKKSSDYYELIRLNPSYKVFFQDNDIEIPATTNAVLDIFEKIEFGSKEKIKGFLDKAGIKYEAAMSHYIHKPSHSITEFIDWKVLTSFFKLNMFSSIRKEIKGIVKHPQVQQILEFPILFLGSTPDTTPALYSMMNYVDTELGTWYPKGGMNEIIKAMVSIAEENGVTFHLEEAVTGVEIQNKNLKKLKTNKGSYEFDYVVCSADYHHFEQEILPEEGRMYNKKFWDKQTMSPSVLLFYLGIDTKIPNLEHHNLFFDADFERHISEIYEEPKWPHDPLFYVCAPSLTDNTVAPETMENLFVLIPIANNLVQDEVLIDKYFNIIAERMERKTNIDIRNHVVYRKNYSVKEFKQDYNAFKGNAYGLANTLFQTAVFKPKMQSKKLKNLLYAGQLTVPGPGLPPSIISGMMVAKEIIKKEN